MGACAIPHISLMGLLAHMCVCLHMYLSSHNHTQQDNFQEIILLKVNAECPKIKHWCFVLKLLIHIWYIMGWQKLVAFRRSQNCPQNFRQTHSYYFRDICVVCTRNCKFANLAQYNMQKTCNSALLPLRNTFVVPKKALFCPNSSKKCINCDKS